MSGPVVTQAARDAAAQRMASNPQARKLAELFVAGEYDGHGLVQAFARFEAEIRTAAEAAASAREAELVKLLYKAHQLFERNVETNTRHDFGEQKLIVEIRATLARRKAGQP